MTLQELLNDPNFQTVVVPLFMALVSVALVWCLGQIPAVQKQAKRWRLFKLAVESSVLGFIGKLFPDAMATFKSDAATAKVIGLLYALALVGVLVLMVADVVQLFSKPSTLTATEMDEARWQDNRQTLMDKAGVKWIDGVLNKSLYQQARIAVGLEERPEMVGVEWQTMGEEKQVLPPGTRLLDRFANLGGGGTLLVLGEPGAGKTTLLLELAQDLLEATDFQELKQPIPIVLNVSAWGTQQFPEDGTLAFTQWLLEELWQQYQVRKEVGQIWLEKEKWTLLLDGLDEVKPQYRDACVEALNQFRQKFGNIEIVLCCRIVDYQKLNTRLEGFQAAVYVQPLTDEQVDEYLKQGGGALVGIAAALEVDSSLRDLTHTPLFLWILTLAYRNRPAQELLNLPENKRLTLLFDRYIERMFVQRPLSSEEEQQQMLRWLQEIAKKTGSGKEFLIERMQPKDWLETARDQWLYRLIYGLIVGLIVGLIYGLIVGLIVGLIYGLIVGLIVGLIGGLTGGQSNIVLVEALEISMSREAGREMLISFRSWLIGGLIFGLIEGLKVDIPDRTFPNQGIWGSLKTMVITVIVSLAFTIILYFPLANILPLFLEPFLVKAIISSVIGLPILFGITKGGGFACIQHFSMRLVLFQTKQIPWNFVTFFKQAEDRLFIYRTGGSYVFVHRYLQEHFANLSFDET
ncbi:NACHT domain-containing protein [Acaryochloris sp. 'Moss Beach']|uniref:NACHT domain-containing protein n=1 Tax=Acaryochloris sp. 'Moss Beach' TaxID=2740837 RepID=UPI001F2ADC8D|nr:NACHT domain-containing protein [Acaryochloris sp. 'Moss Beach']UJB71478.1 NACHT domain-containing protein [Acaryochloris sp. 'Moss Beach']